MKILRKNKYKNKKTTIRFRNVNYVFDSIAESVRGFELLVLNEKGFITNLQFQPEYQLQPRFRRNGKLHRSIKYIADFRYRDADGLIVEDVKSTATVTAIYKLKKKLFLKLYGDGLIFREVYVSKGKFQVVTI